MQVMKRGGEGVLADDMNLGEGAPTVTAEVTVPGEESDDEYEQVPARKEKQRRIDTPEAGRTVFPSREHEARTDVQVRSAETANHPSDHKESDVAPPEPEATDDDWLRSRTNRLLDLVDPDDLPPSATTLPKNGSAEHHDVPAYVSDGPTQETALDDVAGETETTGEGSAADAIRRTSRLFIRNLPYSATEDDIRSALERFGTVEEVRHDLTIPSRHCGYAM